MGGMTGRIHAAALAMMAPLAVMSAMLIGASAPLKAEPAPVSAPAPAAKAAPLKVGDAAPDFTVRLLNGTEVTRAELHGKVIVLNFWATWCAPCREEMPMMDHLARKMDGHIKVIAVLVDTDGPMSAVRRVQKQLAFPIATKMNGPYRTIDNAVPTTYIIDRQGIIRHVQTGAYSNEEFVYATVPLVNEGL